MYLSQEKIKGATHYYIRESYQDGGAFRSRDLFDLGTDPAEYIIYAGGNAFYIDAAVEAHLDNLGVTLQGTDLEDIFWRFLDPDIQHALEYFRHREKRSQKENKSKEVLKKMSRQELVRLFRRKAQELHPDKGGNHEKFVDLTRAYHVLLKMKE